MKTLDEYNKERLDIRAWLKSISNRAGVLCPKCMIEMVESEPGRVLMTDPPKVRVHCTICNHRGFKYQ